MEGESQAKHYISYSLVVKDDVIDGKKDWSGGIENCAAISEDGEGVSALWTCVGA